MLIIGFIMNLAQAMIIIIAGAESSSIPGFGAEVSGLLYTCAIIEIVFGVFALVGATMCFSGRSWGLALVGSIFCRLSIGLVFLGSLCGLIALILIAVSRDEFEGGSPPYQPQYGGPQYGAPAYQYPQDPYQQQGYQDPYQQQGYQDPNQQQGYQDPNQPGY